MFIMNKYWPTIEDLQNARRSYEENEPRDLFYRIAIELTTLAINGKTSISLSEALASLLQTWNRSYYQYRKFDNEHFHNIDCLVGKTLQSIMKLRNKEVGYSKEEAKDLFSDYEDALGPVGAAKCLHLLVPDLFPLWNRAIAANYGLPLRKKGSNADLYIQFLEHALEQCEKLGGNQINGRNTLKSIDEYNYCKFSKKWI